MTDVAQPQPGQAFELLQRALPKPGNGLRLGTPVPSTKAGGTSKPSAAMRARFQALKPRMAGEVQAGRDISSPMQ